MQNLASYIANELKATNQCAVYDPELTRVWPRNGIRRQQQIEKFAKQNGWRVAHYKEGFVAIFVKEPQRNLN